MKGLFVKDIELMKQQKQFFILVVVMEVILNLAGSGRDRHGDQHWLGQDGTVR